MASSLTPASVALEPPLPHSTSLAPDVNRHYVPLHPSPRKDGGMVARRLLISPSLGPHAIASTTHAEGKGSWASRDPGGVPTVHGITPYIPLYIGVLPITTCTRY